MKLFSKTSINSEQLQYLSRSFVQYENNLKLKIHFFFRNIGTDSIKKQYLFRWLNHVVHTNVMVFMLLELFISFRQYPSRGKCLFGLITFIVSYLAWIHVVKHYSGVWVYPILDVLPLPMRIIFFAGAIGATVGFYIIGETLNKKIWTKEIRLGHRKSNQFNKVKKKYKIKIQIYLCEIIAHFFLILLKRVLFFNKIKNQKMLFSALLDL